MNSAKGHSDYFTSLSFIALKLLGENSLGHEHDAKLLVLLFLVFDDLSPFVMVLLA
jgi:hypothetical protein